jgi:hypothetical protein
LPTISIFYGIIIQMFWRDHNPPHVHATYQGMEALFAIGDGKIMRGSLPPGAVRMVSRWIVRHRMALMENWERGRRQEMFQFIPGLDDDE